MQQNLFKKTLITIALVVFFVISPLIAWFITPHYNPDKSRTTDEFYQLIQDYNKTEAADQKVPDLTIKSVQRVKDVWYVLTVSAKDTDETTKMLVADFYHDPGRMNILSLPYKTALQKNISGLGVPYDVIAELNPDLKGDTNE